MEKLTVWLSTHKITALLIIAFLLILAGGSFALAKFNPKPQVALEEVDLPFEAEGPYALTFPRRDGNALVLNLKRTGSYDAISFELAYTSKSDETTVAGNKISSDGEGNSATGAIDRGVVGNIDTKEKKGEYEQEILFGTCSKNVCKYDKGVENGTLTLHIKKGDKAYKMSTQWHIQKPDVSLGVLASGDGHFTYKVNAERESLTNVGFSIVNDLTGAPKLPDGNSVLGKVYALNVPVAKSLSPGDLSFELADKPASEAKIFRYSDSENKWQELDTKINGSKLTAKAPGAGIFAVLAANKK